MNDRILCPAGILDAGAAGRLVARMKGPEPYVLDFSDVDAIHFAALRNPPPRLPFQRHQRI